MTEHLAAPLTSPDCDLKDFPGTMIYRHRLRGSTFNATATDAEFRAGINLWLNAQDQVPAGSLPDNDIELCRLADLGRDQKRWKKIKSVAMRGWFRCADGRLYNRVVAEVVNAQWQTKLDQRNKTLKARIAALEKRESQATDPAAKEDMGEQLSRLRVELQRWQARSSHRSSISGVTEPVTDSVTDSVAASKRREGKESEGKGVVLVPLLRNGQAAPAAFQNAQAPKTAPSPSKPSSDDKTWIFREGLAWLSKATGRPEDRLRSQLGKWRRDTKDDASLIRRVFEEAQDQEIANPIPWITKAIAARMKAAAPFEQADEHEWRKRFESFRANGAWPQKWGGSQPGDHPAHPAALLAEFDFSSVSGGAR